MFAPLFKNCISKSSLHLLPRTLARASSSATTLPKQVDMVNKKYLKTWLDYHSSGKAVTGTAGSTPDVPAIVKDVIDTIRKDGDIAVRKYSEKFDKWSPRAFRLSKAETESAIAACPKQTIEDIKEVQRNVRAFAEAQRKSITDFELEIRPGVHLGQKNIPISAVGW